MAAQAAAPAPGRSQSAGAGRGMQLAQCLELDLAPLAETRACVISARVWRSSPRGKAQFQHLTLLVGQVRPVAAELFLMDAALHLIERLAVGLVGDQIAEETAAPSPLTRASRLEVVRAGAAANRAHRGRVISSAVSRGWAWRRVCGRVRNLADRGQTLRDGPEAGSCGTGRRWPGSCSGGSTRRHRCRLVPAGRVTNRALEDEGTLRIRSRSRGLALVFLATLTTRRRLAFIIRFGALPYADFRALYSVAFVSSTEHLAKHLIASSISSAASTAEPGQSSRGTN